MQKKANPAALLPILEFLLLYLGLGLIFEYVLKIPMGFYSIPIVVIFLVALLAACCQNRALSFDDKLTLMGQGIGDKNIVTMLLIFLAAGIFVGVVGRSKVLHWGGPAITPKLDGAPMGRVFEKARALGVRTSMDTCYDGKGVWLPLIEPSLPHLDIVFSSYEEACNYTGK